MLAGARTAVASLWAADDIFTTALMRRFYAQLRQGADRASALRSANLEILERFGDQALPYHWAGFTMVGDGRVRASSVVHRPDGAPVVDIRKAWARATRAAGCAGLRFHDLRACGVSNLIDAGVPQLDAMKISGHRTDSMIRRYRIVSPEQLWSIGERVEAYLRGKDSEKHPIQSPPF